MENFMQDSLELKLFLTYFQLMFHFYAPWKHQKTYGCLMFSAGIEVEQGLKTG